MFSNQDKLLYDCRWCISDGSNIKVMGEPWLRVDDGHWVTSPQTQEKEANMILVVPLLHMVEAEINLG
jgi:hypothetical protein